MPDEISQLCAAGLALVPIPPVNGKHTKAPTARGWNMPRSRNNPNGYSNNAADFANLKGFNFGLYHGASNSLALDLDDVVLAQIIFEDTTDLQLLDWLESDLRVEVKSPKANRGKLLFKLPVGFVGAGFRQLKHEGKVIFELRSGNCQDVVHGQHPEGGEYRLIGNPAAMPKAPAVLLDILQHWEAWKPCFNSALGIMAEPPKIALRKPQQGGHPQGRRDPIHEYNQAKSVLAVLLANGYKQVGRDRFIRPNSESKAPGAVIMRNCADGIERVYSHGGDVLNDGFAHDAFDCYRLLECGGDFTKALKWNAEITQHNQRLFSQEKAQQTQQHNEQATGQTGQPKANGQPLFPLKSAAELTAKPTPIDWLVKNILEQGSLNLLFGEPGAGKSLFALEWGFCIAAGLSWNDHRTKQADVVIVAGEGYSGYRRRLKALELKHCQKATANLFISQRPAQLLDPGNTRLLADSIKTICPKPGLIIIDTLHRNMDGDENSSQDIGKFISNIDLHLKPMGAAVLVVHHSGHSTKERSRGSSSIRAAMDGEFSATKSENSIVLSCHKAKDFEAFKPLQFSLKVAELDWLDDDDKPMTSVYLECQGEAKNTTKKRKLSARDDAILTSLNEAITAHGIEPTPEIKTKFGGFDSLMGKMQKIVNIEHWRVLAYKAIVVDANTDDARRMAFKRCRDKLLDGKFTVEYDNYAWRIFE
jgi:hypothetical protein